MKKKGKYDTEETSSRRAEGFARGTRGARGNRGEGGNGDTGDTGMADTGGVGLDPNFYKSQFSMAYLTHFCRKCPVNSR